MTQQKSPPAGTEELLNKGVKVEPTEQCSSASHGVKTPDSYPGNGDARRKPNQATQLVRLGSKAQLWHTPDTQAWASIPVDTHAEDVALSSPTFARWLSRRFYEKTGTSPSDQAITEALGVLEGKALYDGVECSVHTRIAATHWGIALDLGDDAHRVVLIRPGEWEVVDRAPVKFRRPKGIEALPEPRRGSSIDALRPYLNLAADRDWVLLVAWLTACLRPGVPCPILDVQGEQGSAKSTTSRLLRSLVDPNSTPLRAEPKEPRDLMIAATNGLLVAFDNLSHLQPWLSDCLCRLSTGGGFSTRTHYSNDEETLFQAMRPVLLNGIEGQATRSDLLDRSIPLRLPAIPDHRRRTESEFWAEFEAEKPALLGALLTTVADALRILPTIKLDRLPRMADFAVWGVAVERALGWRSGTFMAAYAGSRRDSDQTALEIAPIYAPLLHLMDKKDAWNGTLSDLLRHLGFLGGQAATVGWPRSPRALKNQLARLAPNLRRDGINVVLDDGRSADSQRNRLIGFYRIDPQDDQGVLAGPAVAVAQMPIPPKEWERIFLYEWTRRERPHSASCRSLDLEPVAYADAERQHVHAECRGCGYREVLPAHVESVTIGNPDGSYDLLAGVSPVDGSSCPYGCKDRDHSPLVQHKEGKRWWHCDDCGALWLGSSEWVAEPEDVQSVHAGGA